MFNSIWVNVSSNKQFLMNQILWMGISFGISIAISLLLPFPYSLAAIFGVFILLNFYMRRRMMRRMGMGGMFGSMSSSSMFGDNSLNYYCMSCGTKHRQAACPKCGSKMKRVGSWWYEIKIALYSHIYTLHFNIISIRLMSKLTILIQQQDKLA